FARRYAPNLTVSADHIAPLRIDSWIAVRYDHWRRISIGETTLAMKFYLTALPRLRRLLALQPHDESLPRRGANRPPLNLADLPAAGRVPGRPAGGLAVRGKPNQSAFPSSQRELASDHLRRSR